MEKLYIPEDLICDEATGTRYVKLRTLHLVVLETLASQLDNQDKQNLLLVIHNQENSEIEFIKAASHQKITTSNYNHHLFQLAFAPKPQTVP